MMGSAPIIVNGYDIKPSANLRGANLSGAILSCADLRSADLHGADLYGADLHGANLIDADLHGANLIDADLHGANLRGANLRGCIFGRSTSAIFLGTDTRSYDFVAIRHDDGWRIKAGCRWFTLPEAVSHWTMQDNRDALARLAILDAHPLPKGER